MNLEKIAKASAPLNFTLFGYDLDTYDGISIGLALENKVSCLAEFESRFSVNGEDLDSSKHALVRAALIYGWSDVDTPISLKIDEPEYPQNSIGYQSARTISILGSLSLLNDHIIFDDLAQKGYETMASVYKDIAPLGTSAATHGCGVVSSRKMAKNHLWTIKNNGREWKLHHLDVPDMNFVLAFPKAPGPSSTSGMKNFMSRQKSFAKDIFKDAGKIASSGILALEDGDLKAIGELMTKADNLSMILGAYNKPLKNLKGACERNSYGAQICPASGQGFIAALTDKPDVVARQIYEAGGIPVITKTSKTGIEV